MSGCVSGIFALCRLTAETDPDASFTAYLNRIKKGSDFSIMASKLKIIPLGGINEIGKNMTVIEYEGDIIVIDCGLAFPDDEMLGVDVVIPDISYLVKHKSRIRAIILTHGHEDHIGALPYVMRQISAPIYCTRLTAGIIETKFAEHKMLDKVKIQRREAGNTFKAGCFQVEFIRVNHSIADSIALAIHTPIGTIVHTGDYKIDATPVSGEMIDLARFGELGKKGVLLLMADSTNVERDGYTMSESKVGDAFDAQFKNCHDRIIITTFASNVHRLQQILDVAAKYGRKVAITGRSMENILNVAVQLGYIKVPKDVLMDVPSILKLPKSKIVLITTGSQGEPMSALYRIAFSMHKQIDIMPGDKILVAASPIPGNEKSVYKLINELFHKGAEVVYERLAELHASGHACREEMKLMLGLIKPKYFMPVHGEYRHLKVHAELGKQMGVPNKNVFITENGRVLELTATGAKLGTTVHSGRVLVDGSGVGDVGATVLRDRKLLSQDGLIVVVVAIDGESGMIIGGPDIISRGFVYVKESEDIMNNLRKIAREALEEWERHGKNDWASMKSAIKEDLADYLNKKTKRKPMILPVIIES